MTHPSARAIADVIRLAATCNHSMLLAGDDGLLRHPDAIDVGQAIDSYLQTCSPSQIRSGVRGAARMRLEEQLGREPTWDEVGELAGKAMGMFEVE